MVAYTLLCNPIPINGYLIGTNDYEGHHSFDIWYRNTSAVKPTAITGDMHFQQSQLCNPALVWPSL